MAPATRTAHRFHLFAAAFAFATAVALLLPQTLLASQSGTVRPSLIPVCSAGALNNPKRWKGILSNSSSTISWAHPS